MTTPALEMQASFTLQGRNPDVLTCIANLSNDEVFTPPELANEMLDTVADAWAEEHDGESIWVNPEVTFLDPFTKSGVFLREITRRLNDGLVDVIPDLQERVDHILTKQVFGIGITQLTALLARRSVYCSKDATGKHSIAKSFDRDWGNVWFERTEHTWTGGKRSFAVDSLSGQEVVVMTNRRCEFCGAAETDYGRDESLESHAYAFIHTTDPRALLARMFGADVQFDVIIGNPPYQLDDGGAGSSAAPIYDKFVEKARSMDPRYLSLVIPARWYAGGKGLNEFRATMLGDDRLRVLKDYPDTSDVFPGVNNRGGICVFLWDRDHAGEAEVTTHEGGRVTSVAVRQLMEPGLSTFIRYNEGLEILRKVVATERAGDIEQLSLPVNAQFSQLVSARKPFGLDTKSRGASGAQPGHVRMYRNGGVDYIDPTIVESGHDFIDVAKLFVPYASPGSDDYPHLVLSRPIVAGVGEVCSETYLVVGAFRNADQARNAAGYMGTQFFRFMVNLMRVSQHVTKSVYSLAPVQDFREKWDDERLALKYGLSVADREFINRFVKPVSWAKDFE